LGLIVLENLVHQQIRGPVMQVLLDRGKRMPVELHRQELRTPRKKR
jgi:hypothetical protein